MSQFADILRREFPAMDNELKVYVEGVLTGSLDDFESCDDIYEAVGDILQSINAEKSEDNIRGLCDQFFNIIKKTSRNDQRNGKVLNAPVTVAEMAKNMELADKDIQSIWVVNKDIGNKVDLKKLEKAEAKLQQKQEKRQDANSKVTSAPVKLQQATASQVTNKKATKLDQKGLNRSMDIKIENFDLAFGDKVLLQNANLLLSFGRRYGLVGRNGLGKTTLLRMISERQLAIPSHISVLHVEQEVVGDETKAVDSVLECDTERARLLAREKEILALLNNNTSTGITNALNNATIDGDDGGGGTAAGTTNTPDSKLSNELSEIYIQLQNIEADKAVARASVIHKF